MTETQWITVLTSLGSSGGSLAFAIFIGKMWLSRHLKDIERERKANKGERESIKKEHTELEKLVNKLDKCLAVVKNEMAHITGSGEEKTQQIRANTKELGRCEVAIDLCWQQLIKNGFTKRRLSDELDDAEKDDDADLP